jgi:hypothetical protein
MICIYDCFDGPAYDLFITTCSPSTPLSSEVGG